MEICLANDYVGLKQAPLSQGDHQCMVLLVHKMPRTTQVVLKHYNTLQCANTGETWLEVVPLFH
jgi:hypothetical protein